MPMVLGVLLVGEGRVRRGEGKAADRGSEDSGAGVAMIR